MKKIFILGLLAMFTTPVFAEIHPYIAGNLDISFIDFGSSVKQIESIYDIKLSDVYFGGGAEAGIKFGKYEHIWNGAVAVSYDYLFDRKASNLPIYTGFSSTGIVFDNYIRIDDKQDNRIDLILGAGLANATERTSINDYNEKQKTKTVVLKFGLNEQMTEYMDIFFTIRNFIPQKDLYVNSVWSLQWGAKLVF